MPPHLVSEVWDGATQSVLLKGTAQPCHPALSPNHHGCHSERSEEPPYFAPVATNALAMSGMATPSAPLCLSGERSSTRSSRSLQMLLKNLRNLIGRHFSAGINASTILPGL